MRRRAGKDNLYYNSRMTSLSYPTVLFDWGDTVMYDNPSLTAPMAEWSTVHAVEGIAEALADLQTSGRRIILATGAMVSDESQIRAALAKVGLDSYFSHIYCFQNTRIPKSEAFYRRILSDLDLRPSDALMVGDSFEKDVLAANAAGIFGVWFNQISDENRNHELHATIQSMQDLRAFFQSLDQ